MRKIQLLIVLLLSGIALQAENTISDTEIKDLFTHISKAMNQPMKHKAFITATEKVILEARSIEINEDNLEEIFDNEFDKQMSGEDLSEKGLIYRDVSGDGWDATIVASPIMIYPMAIYLSFKDYPIESEGYSSFSGTYYTVVPNSSILKISTRFQIVGDGIIKSINLDTINGETKLFQVNNVEMNSSILFN